MGAIPVHHTATVDTAWDGPGAVADMPAEAATLRYCHAWVDGEMDEDMKQSYKFPHHRTRGGPANLPAVRNALARLSQADIPSGDDAGVKRHLQAHLDDAQGSDALNLGGIEQRTIAAEMRVDQEGSIEGYAAVFNVFSEPIMWFKEKIRAGAFAKTIKEADVRGLFNHDANYVLGRNKAKTLELKEDDHGLFFRVKPPDTQWARDLQQSVSRGDINQASFAFSVIREEWKHTKEDKQLDERELVEVRLYDVSVVTFPAYPQTNVSARSLAEMFLAQIQANSDPETIQYLRDQLSQLETPAPELELHPEGNAEGQGLESLARRRRRLEILTLE